MSKYLPKSAEGRALAIVGLFVAAVLAVFMVQRAALAAPYANPFWVNNSGSPESALPSVANLAIVTEGKRCRSDSCGRVRVDVRTGEFFWDHVLFRTPGLVQDNVFAIRWRSMIGGASQLGRQILPSWETYVLLMPGTPNAPNGHRVDIRRPSGRVDAFMWNGAAYAGPGDVFDTLTTNAGGNYVLTDKYGNSTTFDARGMPAQATDRNGNTDTPQYDASYRMTAFTDDRPKSYTINHNGHNIAPTSRGTRSRRTPGSRRRTPTRTRTTSPRRSRRSTPRRRGRRASTTTRTRTGFASRRGTRLRVRYWNVLGWGVHRAQAVFFECDGACNRIVTRGRWHSAPSSS